MKDKSAREIFEEIVKKREEQQRYSDLVQSCKEKIEIMKLEYRIKSVIEKLERLRSKNMSGECIDLDSELVNCLNKLYGNIDGYGDLDYE